MIMPQLRLHVDEREEEIPATIPFPCERVGRPASMPSPGQGATSQDVARGIEHALDRLEDRLRELSDELDEADSLPFPSMMDDDGPRAA